MLPSPPPPLASRLLCLADAYDGEASVSALRTSAALVDSPAPRLLSAAERGVRALRSALRSRAGTTLSTSFSQWAAAAAQMAAAEREAELLLALQRHADARRRSDALWRAKLAEAAGGACVSPFERVENLMLTKELAALEDELQEERLRLRERDEADVAMAEFTGQFVPSFSGTPARDPATPPSPPATSTATADAANACASSIRVSQRDTSGAPPTGSSKSADDSERYLPQLPPIAVESSSERPRVVRSLAELYPPESYTDLTEARPTGLEAEFPRGLLGSGGHGASTALATAAKEASFCYPGPSRSLDADGGTGAEGDGCQASTIKRQWIGSPISTHGPEPAGLPAGQNGSPAHWPAPAAPNLRIDATSIQDANHLTNTGREFGSDDTTFRVDAAMDSDSFDGIADRISQLEMTVGLEPLTPLAAAAAQREQHSTPPSRGSLRCGVRPISMSAIDQVSRSYGASPVATPLSDTPPAYRSRLSGRQPPRVPHIVRPAETEVSKDPSNSQASTPSSCTPPLAGSATHRCRARARTAPLDPGRALIPHLPLSNGRRLSGGDVDAGRPHSIEVGLAAQCGPRLWGGTLTETAAEAAENGHAEVLWKGSPYGADLSALFGGRCNAPAPWSDQAPPISSCAHIQALAGSGRLPTTRSSVAHPTPRDAPDNEGPKAPPTGFSIHSPPGVRVAAQVRTPPPSLPLSPEGRRALWSGGLPSQQPSPH